MEFKEGDIVRLIDEAGQGPIRRIESDQITVEIDGFELVYRPEDLVKVEHDQLIENKPNDEHLSAKDKASRSEGRAKLNALKAKTEATYELDLHIHELLDDYRNMSNGEILKYQMRCCKSFLKEARENRYKKVVLIHGVGEGVLKREIHDLLDGLDRVTYHDAPYRTYGYGATEVVFG